MELQDQPLTAPEAAENVTPEVTSKPTPLTKTQIVEAMEELSGKDAAEISRDDINRLRVQFYAIRHEEIAKEKAAYLAVEGNAEENFTPAEDAEEERFKAAYLVIKDKKQVLAAEQTAARLDNLVKKNAIIEEINSAADDTDSVHLHIERVRELQQQFKEIGEVPDTDASDLWKRYQQSTERFYDQLRVNKDLRDLDFRKNLEIKTHICDEAQALTQEPDIVVAFRRLQDLHNHWRETGPVAKEIREEIWTRFKDLSAEINKRYQAFFEERKAQEAQNEAAKIVLCERVEAINPDELKSHAQWDESTATVLAAQEEWKGLGFASRKTNGELFKRFRTVCDNFFAAKAEHFRSIREGQADNLAKKISLCEVAEELKESTDWKKTADKLQELQAKWKEIGAVSKKQSDAVWARFRSACDYFFDRKKQAESETRHSEQENLRLKKEIVAKLEAINPADETLDRKEAIATVRSLMDEYQKVGHVPFRDKDKIHEAYRAQVSRLYDALDMNNRRAARQNFENSLKDLEGNNSELRRQKERLQRALETKRNEIKTFENNLGFFNTNSKGGEAMLKDMQSRIGRLRQELAEIQQKIELVDAKLNA